MPIEYEVGLRPKSGLDVLDKIYIFLVPAAIPKLNRPARGVVTMVTGLSRFL